LPAVISDTADRAKMPASRARKQRQLFCRSWVALGCIPIC